ncbi:hypothetical protein SAMN02745157_0762 [Kaistia soli DSM 19436]|uniref:Uncharacterized protein n=1 Tax=Kaistia soli DSM 19436 TaxID=1122133 RepID=A0A1M4VPK2_9HYPH|nr:hypothetical protein [Kaistia soli]SHE70984.1 hypothetical protein SAMN02745157_0762 [Kaistia soli DSM 19436]
MPQVVFVALVGALGIIAVRALARQKAAVAIRIREAERSMANRPLATLVQDPVTGIYRPLNRDY